MKDLAKQYYSDFSMLLGSISVTDQEGWELEICLGIEEVGIRVREKNLAGTNK